MTKDYTYCPNCGEKNKADNKFCLNCGKELSQIERSADEPKEKKKEEKVKVQETANRQSRKKENKGISKKLIGGIGVLLVIVALAFVYFQQSDSSSNLFASAEEIWLPVDEDEEMSVKLIGQDEAWLMAGYDERLNNKGRHNYIFDLEKLESDHSLRLRSHNLKTVEMYRLPPLLWLSSDMVYELPIEFEFFNIDYDYDEDESYFNLVLEDYLDTKTFEEIVSKHKEMNDYLNQRTGSVEEKKKNMATLLSDYVDENTDEQSIEAMLDVRRELSEAIVKENKDFLEEKIQDAQLVAERELEESSIMTETEAADLRYEMREEGLETDEFDLDTEVYLDEEELSLVLAMTNLSKSAQYSSFGRVEYIFDILPADHSDNDYGEEVLMVYPKDDPTDKAIFIKQD